MASALDSLTNPVNVVGVQPLTQASDVVANESSANSSGYISDGSEVRYQNGVYVWHEGKWYAKNVDNLYNGNYVAAPYLQDTLSNLYYENSSSSSSSAEVSALDQMSEREFSEYMTKFAHDLGVESDSTKYQRSYEDLLKTGLNPRLILDNAATNGVSASSAYNYSESSNESKSENKSNSNSMSWSALIVGVLMLLGSILGA